MNFFEKLEKLINNKVELTEKENTQFKEAEPVKDLDKVNKDPESRIEIDKKYEIPKEVKDFKDFLNKVNPIWGEVKRCSLFNYVKDFRKRGKDTIIMKGEKGGEVMPFCAVDRGELVSYTQGIMYDEEAYNKFKNDISTIYVIEEMEMLPDDYIDFLINGKISLMNNPGNEFEIEGQSDHIPTINTPKNQEELSIDTKQIEK